MDNFSSFTLEDRLQLNIERQLSLQMDDIILKMQANAKKFEIAQADKKSPFKNALSVATESSLEAIKTFIRCQLGRKDSSPVWKIKKDDEPFATAVANQIEGLSDDVEKILQSVQESTSKDSTLQEYLSDPKKQEKLRKELHLKLAQLYLGYLAREHTALVGEAEHKKK